MANVIFGGRFDRSLKLAGTALGALLCVAGPVMAATTGTAEAPAEGGLPQLNPENFAPQIVWLAISFIALYLLMSRVALPRIAEVLEERQERIADDLDKASALREESEQVMAAYEKALADARTEAQGVLAQVTAEINQAAAERQSVFATELASKTRAAEERIAAAKQTAVANIREIAVDTARQAVSKLAGVEVDQAAAEAAVTAVMKGRA